MLLWRLEVLLIHKMNFHVQKQLNRMKLLITWCSIYLSFQSLNVFNSCHCRVKDSVVDARCVAHYLMMLNMPSHSSLLVLHSVSSKSGRRAQVVFLRPCSRGETRRDRLEYSMNIPDVFVYLSEQYCDMSAVMKDKDMVSLTTTELFSSVMFVLAVWADRKETLNDDSIDWITLSSPFYSRGKKTLLECILTHRLLEKQLSMIIWSIWSSKILVK